MPYRHIHTLLLSLSLFLPQVVSATGMQPETSLLLIREAEQGGSMKVQNTDTVPSLLYTQIVDLEDEQSGIQLLVTQPVVRVEPGQTQQVRFILKTAQPLTTEHMMRVTFEGIPPKIPGQHRIGMTIRHDIPVLIHPKGLPEMADPWKELQWSLQGDSVQVNNPSPYVVRLAQQVVLLPSQATADLSKTYIPPNQTLKAKVSKTVAGDNQIKIVPASRYGVQVESYTAPLH
ncbi:MAG: fimbria/pilus chaperone family protein [Enterobacteriaceae bacterium]